MNRTIRESGKYTLHANFGRVVLLFLIVTLLPSVFSFTSAFNNLETILTNMVDQISYYGFDRYVSRGYFENDLEMLSSAFVSGSLLLSVASFVLQSLMTAGYNRALLMMTKGQTPKESVLFGHWRHILTCVLVPLWVSLKSTLWLLPGLAVYLLGVMLGNTFGAIIALGGSVLMLVLVIPASLRYAMAPYVLADTPEISVYDAVEKSKCIMDGRKAQLFRLCMPYILFTLLTWAAYIVNFSLFIGLELIGVFSIWLLIVLFFGCLMLTLYLSLLSRMAIAQFYTTYTTKE